MLSWERWDGNEQRRWERWEGSVLGRWEGCDGSKVGGKGEKVYKKCKQGFTAGI